MPATELNNTILKNSSNLKAYYRLESGALTTDSSGNAYSLTNNNSVADGTGKFGGGADFGASNTTKYFDTSSNLGITGKTGTISLWVKLNTEITTGVYTFAYHQQTTTDNGFIIRYEYNTGTRRIAIGTVQPGTGYSLVYSNTSLGTSSWHHLVLSSNGTTFTAYLDGASVGSASVSSNGSNVSSRFVIGAEDNTAGTIQNYASALIDDVGVFDSALSADNIKELYEGRVLGELRPQTNLVGLWHLNGNSTDSSGSNLNGTDTGITYSSVNGKFGSGAGFNGTTSKIDLGASSTLRPTTVFSLFMWIKIPASAQYERLFSSFDFNGATTYRGIALQLTNNGYLAGEADTGSQYYEIASQALDDGKWHFVGMTFDTTNGVYLYVDGVKVSTTRTGTIGTIATPAVNAYIGMLNFNGTLYYLGNGGCIDEVQFFNAVKSASWVRNQYAIGRFGEI